MTSIQLRFPNLQLPRLNMRRAKKKERPKVLRGQRLPFQVKVSVFAGFLLQLPDMFSILFQKASSVERGLL